MLYLRKYSIYLQLVSAMLFQSSHSSLHSTVKQHFIYETKTMPYCRSSHLVQGHVLNNMYPGSSLQKHTMALICSPRITNIALFKFWGRNLS